MPGPVLKEHVRFFLVYVQAGRTDLPGLDAFQQGFRVNQAAPGGVHDHDALLHLSDGVRVDHVAGFIRQRAVEGDDVAPLQQLIQGNVFDSAVLCREQVVGDHVHPEAAADVDEDPPDLAGTDHAHGLSVEIEAGQPVQGEIELARPVICLVDPAHGSQQQCDGVLRHGIRGIGRDMDHMDFTEGGLQVHVVVAGRAQRNQPDTVFIQLFDDRRVDGVVDKYAYGFTALCEIHGVFIELCLQVFEPDAVLSAVQFKRGLVICLCVEECHFDHFAASLSGWVG